MTFVFLTHLSGGSDELICGVHVGLEWNLGWLMCYVDIRMKPPHRREFRNGEVLKCNEYLNGCPHEIVFRDWSGSGTYMKQFSAYSFSASWRIVEYRKGPWGWNFNESN